VLNVSGELDGMWDSGRISQVLSNLICNALQHGSQTEPISVSLTGETGNVILTVRNVGMPIPEEEIRHIFEPLRRYSATPPDHHGSVSNLGLGLYITREVVMAHSGTINVVSNKSEGTKFTVHLPKQKACRIG
jgi:signal transduction histidine kinase